MLFVKESVIRATREAVFAFHERPDALALLLPPWEDARVVQAARISETGSQAIVETRVFGPFKARWVAEHTEYDPPNFFEDVQVSGPFRKWRHRHLVKPHADGAILRDEIDYEPPFGFLGRLVAPILIQKRLRRLFDYRHEETRRWCERARMKDEGGRRERKG
ncbi:MAG TPA: SRPBCC family protein, partial [Pyrinomonadaceae bacterium]|nr:SRPBCC family protein [Pyrinomonadaceae bacterium]